jgi:hypothetical protein
LKTPRSALDHAQRTHTPNVYDPPPPHTHTHITTRYVKPFEDEMKEWSLTLNTVQDIVDESLKVR